MCEQKFVLRSFETLILGSIWSYSTKVLFSVCISGIWLSIPLELILFSWSVRVQSIPPQPSFVNLMLCTWSYLTCHILPSILVYHKLCNTAWRWDEHPGMSTTYILTYMSGCLPILSNEIDTSPISSKIIYDDFHGDCDLLIGALDLCQFLLAILNVPTSTRIDGSVSAFDCPKLSI